MNKKQQNGVTEQIIKGLFEGQKIALHTLGIINERLKSLEKRIKVLECPLEQD